jgi:hypothetical protein
MNPASRAILQPLTACCAVQMCSQGATNAREAWGNATMSRATRQPRENTKNRPPSPSPSYPMRRAELRESRWCSSLTWTSTELLNQPQIRPSLGCCLPALFERFFKLLYTPLVAELRLQPGQIRSPVVASRPSVPWLDLPSRVGAVEDVLRSPVPTSKQFCHGELPGVVTPRGSSLVTDGVSFECVSSLASSQWSSTRHTV